MKKFLSILLSVCIFLCASVQCFAAGFSQQLWTETYLVMDLSDCSVLAESNASERMYPASLTKMMTAIVAYDFYTDPENYNCPQGLDTLISASENAAQTEPTKFGLKLGEEMTVDEALNIMLLMSANDIAVMVAEAIGGTTEFFARMMNEKAAEIGCTDTHFVTPNGLHDDEHYSTAYDIAKIASYLLQNDYLAGIVCQPSYDYAETNKHNAGTVNNTNQLMNGTDPIYVGAEKRTTKYDANILGVKTGTTPEAGGCLVAAAEKNNMKVLVVILNSRLGNSYLIERYSDAHKLLDWVFASYKNIEYAKAGDSYGTIKVKHGEFNKVEVVLSEDVTLRLPVEVERSAVTTSYEINESVTAPFEAGVEVGQLHISLANTEIESIPLIAAAGIEQGGILSVFGVEDTAAHKIFTGIGIFFGIVFVLFVSLIIVRTINKRKARLRKIAKAKKKAELERLKRQQWEEDYENRYASGKDE